jgi:hypothetical protein
MRPGLFLPLVPQLRKWIRNFEHLARAQMEGLDTLPPPAHGKRQGRGSSGGAGGSSSVTTKRQRKESPRKQAHSPRSMLQRAAAQRCSFSNEDEDEDDEDEDVDEAEEEEETFWGDEDEDEEFVLDTARSNTSDRTELRCDSSNTSLSDNELDAEIAAGDVAGCSYPKKGCTYPVAPLSSVFVQVGDAKVEAEMRTPSMTPMRVSLHAPVMSSEYALAATLTPPKGSAPHSSAMMAASEECGPHSWVGHELLAPLPAGSASYAGGAGGFNSQQAGPCFNAISLCNMPGSSSGVVSSGGFDATSFMPAPSAVPWLAAPSDTATGAASAVSSMKAEAAAAAATATAVVAAAQNQAYALLAEAFYLQQQQLGHAALLPGHFGTNGSGGAPHGEWSEMHETLNETPADAWVNEWCARPRRRRPHSPHPSPSALLPSPPAPRPPPSTRPRSLADRPGLPISQAA